MVKKNSKHYVDNPTLFAEMIKYKTACELAKREGKPKPRVPNTIGAAILQIANRLATKHNFARYTYRDEMISDGIENCIRYIDNFDPEKTNNPFAYFTQILFFAYVRRIKTEKKESNKKHKLLESMNIMNPEFDMDDHINPEISRSVEEFDRMLDKKKKKKVKKDE